MAPIVHAQTKILESSFDHRDFLASLSADKRVALTTKSNAKGLFSLAIHSSAILVTTALIIARPPVWQLLLVVQGILLIFLFTLLHETIHRTAFKSGWLNDIVARICGLLIVLPPTWFRHFHIAHHRHTQDPQNDPELASHKPRTRKEYLIHVTGAPVWISQIKTLWRNASGCCDDDYVPQSSSAMVRLEARAMVALYGVLLVASLLSQSTLLLFVWLIPLVAGQPFLRMYLLAEHGHCPRVSNMFMNTRTTLTNSLVRRIAWNMPYHTEHHTYPAVPFHALPALHQYLQVHLHVTERGYARFNRRYIADMPHAHSNQDSY